MIENTHRLNENICNAFGHVNVHHRTHCWIHVVLALFVILSVWMSHTILHSECSMEILHVLVFRSFLLCCVAKLNSQTTQMYRFTRIVIQLLFFILFEMFFFPFTLIFESGVDVYVQNHNWSSSKWSIKSTQKKL